MSWFTAFAAFGRASGHLQAVASVVDLLAERTSEAEPFVTKASAFRDRSFCRVTATSCSLRGFIEPPRRLLSASVTELLHRRYSRWARRPGFQGALPAPWHCGE